MPPASDSAPIQFCDVVVRYDAHTVLDGISFVVRRGETKVLLGEAGAGKTVILKLALGLDRVDSGTVTVLGQPVSAMPESELFGLRRHIGMVFQESALFDSMSVRDNVAYRLIEERKLDDNAIDVRVRECLEAVGLEEAIDKMPSELSGGMRRRVSIARALATHPEIMLYDSPTGGLDPVTATNIMEHIIRLRDQFQVTSLLVTHRLQDAFLMATHCWDAAAGRLRAAKPENSHTSFLLLHEGKVLFDGSAPDLIASRDPYTRRFLNA